MTKNKNYQVAVIIPAYNEEQTIRAVISDVQKIVNQIIVIDDGSNDQTSEIAENMGVKVYRHMFNLGLGATLITGFAAALKNKADIIVTMDADGQHKAENIAQLIKPIISQDADIVIGSRLLYQGNHSMPGRRRFYNHLANFITYLIYGIKTTDSQSGLRAFSSVALKKIELTSQRMEISSEIFREIKDKNLRLVEVPIPAIYTSYSLSKGQSFTTGVKTFFSLILNRLILF